MGSDARMLGWELVFDFTVILPGLGSKRMVISCISLHVDSKLREYLFANAFALHSSVSREVCLMGMNDKSCRMINKNGAANVLSGV